MHSDQIVQAPDCSICVGYDEHSQTSVMGLPKILPTARIPPGALERQSS